MKNTVSIRLWNNSYSISEPNVGQILNMESFRMAFSGGNYNQMRQNYLNPTTRIAVDIVDAMAAFRVLLPNLEKDFETLFKAKSYFDLDPQKAKELVRVFKEFVSPFLAELEKEWFAEIGETQVEEAKNS